MVPRPARRCGPEQSVQGGRGQGKFSSSAPQAAAGAGSEEGVKGVSRVVTRGGGVSGEGRGVTREMERE